MVNLHYHVKTIGELQQLLLNLMLRDDNTLDRSAPLHAPDFNGEMHDGVEVHFDGRKVWLEGAPPLEPGENIDGDV